jgi:hypothetical protein
VITKNFEVLWRELQPRIEGALRARGTDPDTARDIGQEVAIRLMATDTDFEDEEHVLRWCHLVGRRLAANHYRDQARLLVGVVPDREAADRTEDVVSGRLALAEVVTAIGTLTDAERASLFDDASADTRQGRVTQAVRRHRVRKRLLALTSGAFGWLAGIPLLRRLLRPQTVAIAALPLVLTLAMLPSDRPHVRERIYVRPVPGEATTRAATATTPADISSSTAVPPTTATTSTVPPLPLAPLHGTEVPLPTEDASVEILAGSGEPIFCMWDDPLLGEICIG